MAKFGIAPGPARTRRRVATAFAAAGALLLSSGLVLATAGGAVAAPGDNPGKAAGADNGNKGGNGKGKGQGGGNGGSAGGGNGGSASKVAICHRRAGDKNPYGIMYVAANSTVLEAHRDHQTDDDGKGEDKYWKSDVVWNGIAFDEGDYKPDYIFGDAGTPEDLAEFEAWCMSEPGGPDDGEVTASLSPLSWGPNTCDAPGWVREPKSANASYTIDDAEVWSVTTGVHTVKATLTNAATAFAGPTFEWSLSSDKTVATQQIDLGDVPDDCPASLNASAVKIAKCGEWGSVTAVDTDFVDYSVPGDKWSGLQGDVVVSAKVTSAKHKLPASVEGWTISPNRKSAQRTFELGTYKECSDPGKDPDEDPKDTLVSPRYPSATDATCSRDGRLVIPTQPKGVRVTRTGSVPGPVTFTYSPETGYAFPAGTDRSVTVQVEAQLTGLDCIQGVETVRPNPQPGTEPVSGPVNGGNDAEVLGEQAVAVPTAVAAGMGDTMTATSSIRSPQLAQALVVAGLLMLIAGGATGLGRRTRGAHES